MDKEDFIVGLQSRFGLTADHLDIEFLNEEKKVRIKYDLRDYRLLRPLNLDQFWDQLCGLPSAVARGADAEKKEMTVQREEVESLLQRLDPPIQA